LSVQSVWASDDEKNGLIGHELSHHPDEQNLTFHCPGLFSPKFFEDLGKMDG
jgi:hypothetical protein